MSFQITQRKDSNNNLTNVTLINGQCSASIMLNQGGSLQALTIANIPLITELVPMAYKDSFASAILFPFANRVEGGCYTFEQNQYQLEVNELDRNNALHGFLHNKTFEIVQQHTSNTTASVLLEYVETKFTKGYPFTYSVQLEYILQATGLTLKVKVFNTSKNSFPFTIGWHPYFTSADLANSSIQFDRESKIILNKNLIATGAVACCKTAAFTIANKKLDDAYKMSSNTIEFCTPTYDLTIVSSETNGYLQLYTPPVENVIAIEPTTGISNSFNHKKGLKYLAPKQTYEVTWQLQLLAK